MSKFNDICNNRSASKKNGVKGMVLFINTFQVDRDGYIYKCKCVVVRLTLCMHVHSSWNDTEKNSMATSCMTKDDRHKSRMPQTVAQKRRGKRAGELCIHL